MSKRPRPFVDLGPLYLQVGDEAGVNDAPTPSQNADSGDVARFNSILERGRGQEEQQNPTSPEMLLGPARGVQPEHLADTDDIGEEIAFLWVGTGVASAREVRVGMRESLLPQTSIRICEEEGRLRVEFTCGTARVADWLDRKLRALARELGERMNREIELSVSMSGGHLVGSQKWTQHER